MKRLCIFIFFLLVQTNVFSQYIFKEKFEDCNTDYFVMESDSISVKTKQDIIQVLSSHFEREVVQEIHGVLFLQVLVNLKGDSCLLSLENKTNIKTEKLNLKIIIDDHLKWFKPKERIAAIFAIKFYANGAEAKRIGLNGKKGFHVLRE